MGSLVWWCCFFADFLWNSIYKGSGKFFFFFFFKKKLYITNHTITIGMRIMDTQFSSLFYSICRFDASIRPKGPKPWMSAVIKSKLLFYICDLYKH
jgi:hypothetical protein